MHTYAFFDDCNLISRTEPSRTWTHNAVICFLDDYIPKIISKLNRKKVFRAKVPSVVPVLHIPWGIRQSKNGFVNNGA
jgi:hypothetical protein